ncbi:DUF5689 domain-containing protein [Filimonas effusa]|uniref:DUF5689 domain-containing protein n=1 Tax=Filimonas effusa TaxID=2508721 RepID=A0A4V1M9C7_9BACT|nr:DUF5689 domain-containing protein [Filimonas effusa]RXK80599.1 hypothetical protein ESB13_23480 [Filimonas effusa]
MKKKSIALQLTACLQLIYCLITAGCRPSFELPGDYPEPDITATHSIRALKEMHTYPGKFSEVTVDAIISGIVVADDRTGNFYKTIVIQDTSGGIALCINALDLYNNYPVGRRVFVKAKGLLLFDYRGLMQLGAGIGQSNPNDLSLAGIPASLCSRYLIKGSLNNMPEPLVVTPALLTKNRLNRYQNTLIRLENMQLDAGDTASTYAISTALQARSVPLRNCNGDSVLLRNSAYASFAADRMPSGNGSATGIFTVFGAVLQLMIRDTNDLQLYATRCTAPGGGEVEPPDTLDTPYESGLALTATPPLSINFDDLAEGLPAGVSVRTGASGTDSGNIGIMPTTRVSWNSSGGGFKNLASASALPATASASVQLATMNRALGVRQVAATDKGVAFVFLINNTLGKKNIGIQGVLQSLDASISRIANWNIDYAIGAKPVAFTVLPAGNLGTGGGNFGKTTFSAVLPPAVDNRASRVWIRIVVLTATSGSGSRPLSAIDDIQLYWE